MKFTSVIPDDLPQIAEWIEADDYHRGKVAPEFFLTGSDCYVATCYEDNSGPVLYIRIDKEYDLGRVSVQFPNNISKKRIASAVVIAISTLAKKAQLDNFKGLVYDSVNPELIQFVHDHLGFEPAGNDNYILKFSRT